MTREEALAEIKERVFVTEEYFNDSQVDYVDIEALRVAIKALEQSEPHWIPCSEKLPDYGESVLTWDGITYCVEKRIPCIRDEHGEPIYSDWWVSDDYDEFDSEYYPNLRDGACIAWMPLPEPYRGEGEE